MGEKKQKLRLNKAYLMSVTRQEQDRQGQGMNHNEPALDKKQEGLK